MRPSQISGLSTVLQVGLIDFVASVVVQGADASGDGAESGGAGNGVTVARRRARRDKTLSRPVRTPAGELPTIAQAAPWRTPRPGW